MPTIDKLKYLVDELHIPLNVIAPYCKCTPPSIRNYIVKKYPPTEKMLTLIEAGINEFLKDFKEKMGE